MAAQVGRRFMREGFETKDRSAVFEKRKVRWGRGRDRAVVAEGLLPPHPPRLPGVHTAACAAAGDPRTPGSHALAGPGRARA